jgi:YD repeat-containing protein
VQQITASTTATTTYRYDALDRLKETEDPLGGITQQIYDEEGKLTETRDARTVPTIMEYDSTSRMIKVIDGANNIIETVYGDSTNALEGLVAERRYPTYRERYRYDSMDRVIETEQILSQDVSYRTSMSYDGRGQVRPFMNVKNNPDPGGERQRKREEWKERRCGCEK